MSDTNSLAAEDSEKSFFKDNQKLCQDPYKPKELNFDSSNPENSYES